MRLGILLLLLGLASLAFGGSKGGAFWLLAWLGADLMAVSLAYFNGWHRIFGKRRDGTLPWWSCLLFAPFLFYTWAVWHLMRWINHEPASNAVTDQLVLARRLLPSEVEGTFDNYVDLTAEFAEPKPLRVSPAYLSFPILDACSLSPEALNRAIGSLRPGRTLVHCAQGHGRTGLFALAMLLKSGAAKNIEDGLATLRKARPRVWLDESQRRCIEGYVELLKRG